MEHMLQSVIASIRKIIFLTLFAYFVAKVIVAVGKLENKEMI